jgi:hypothetical protein
MVEPEIRARTGLTVRAHQERTIASYQELRLLAPDVPWAPVLQGWTLGEYFDHVDMYARAGVALDKAPVVGVGSVCRRQNTIRAALLVRLIARDTGLRLHLFGFKVHGLVATAGEIASADSMAWSLNARRSPPLPGCAHRRCSSCLRWALEWREALLTKLDLRNRSANTRAPDLLKGSREVAS